MLVITILAILSAATGAVALASSTGTLNAEPAEAGEEQGMTGSVPFQDPPDAVMAAGSDGDLTLTLDAHDTRFEVSGKSVEGQSYNGTFVAPTIRFNPRAPIAVRLVNHLPVATDVHFHGPHIGPANHSDDDFVCVSPGDSYTYLLATPADNPHGTYWYHARALGTTCPSGGTGQTAAMSDTGDVGNQTFAGLSGALIVSDDRTLLQVARQRTLDAMMNFLNVTP